MSLEYEPASEPLHISDNFDRKPMLFAAHQPSQVNQAHRLSVGDSNQGFQSLELWDQQMVLAPQHTHTVECGGFVDMRFTGQFGSDCTT